MKKGNQIFLLIVALIALGILWRFTGTYIQAKNEKAEAQRDTELQSYDSLKEISSTQESSESSEKKYIAIEPNENWKNILIGEWNLFEKEESQTDSWEIESDVEFKKNQSFKMHSTVIYYDYDEETADNKYPIIMKGGGVVEGNWKVYGNILRLTANRSTISKNYSAPVENLRIPRDYSDSTFRDSSFFQQREYGTFSDDDYKTDIEKFNNDTILIEGKNFTTGAKVSYLFVKSK